MIDEGTVRQYKSDLTDEIEPQINELLERAEKGLKTLIRKENLVQAKVSQLTSHISNAHKFWFDDPG